MIIPVAHALYNHCKCVATEREHKLATGTQWNRSIEHQLTRKRKKKIFSRRHWWQKTSHHIKACHKLIKYAPISWLTLSEKRPFALSLDEICCKTFRAGNSLKANIDWPIWSYAKYAFLIVIDIALKIQYQELDLPNLSNNKKNNCCTHAVLLVDKPIKYHNSPRMQSSQIYKLAIIKE